MSNFTPEHGMWVVFKAKLPDGCEAFLDLKRKSAPPTDVPEHLQAHAYHTAAPHKSGDGFHVGIYSSPKRGAMVNGVESAPPPPLIWLVNVMGDNVPTINFGNPQFPRWKQNVTFSLDEVTDLAAADTDDLPPGRHPSAAPRYGSAGEAEGIPPAMPLQRPARKRA